MSRARTAAGMAIILGSLTMLVAFTVPSDVGLAAGRKPKPPVTTTVRKLAPGVKLTKIVNRRIPRRTFILAIDPSKGATLRFILSNDLIPDLERTSSMARRSDALAAVNGDLGSISTGRPTHPMAIDGELIQTSLDMSGSFADRRRRVHAHRPAGDRRLRHPDGDGRGVPDRVMERLPPTRRRSQRIHGRRRISFGPPKDACWARLSPVTEADPGPDGVVRDYSVTETSCTPAPPSARGDVDPCVPARHRRGGVHPFAVGRRDDQARLVVRLARDRRRHGGRPDPRPRRRDRPRPLYDVDLRRQPADGGGT